MRIPNLSRIVETHVPIASPDPDAIVEKIRKQVLPVIRKLGREGKLQWYSLLLHGMRHLEGGDPQDQTLIIHLRLEPSSDLSIDDFVAALPSHFVSPHPVILSEITGLGGRYLQNNDWAFAWAVIGSAATFVLDVVEAHPQNLPPSQTIQFLHFITNALGLGHQSIFAPNAQRF
jgi:hypothetical protein